MNFIRIILAILVMSIVPMSLLCSPETFWELGPVETGDLVVLLLGASSCLSWYKLDGVGSYFRPVWKVGGLIFFLSAAREASWGRIFMATGTDSAGPIIPGMSDLWFGTYIHITVGILILILLYMMYKYRHELGDLVYRLLRSKEAMLYFGILIVLLGSATVIWDPNRIKSLGRWHQALEEMSEITAYFSAYALVWKAHLLSQETVVQDRTDKSNVKK